LKQKVLLLLLKHFCGKSNRAMEWMVILFSLLTNVDVSYKTIERLYSEDAVQLAIFNLHSLLLKKKGIKQADCSERDFYKNISKETSRRVVFRKIRKEQDGDSPKKERKGLKLPMAPQPHGITYIGLEHSFTVPHSPENRKSFSLIKFTIMKNKGYF